MAEPIPIRLAYLGLDGFPRSVPINHVWNGKAFLFATPNLAYKVRAIEANPAGRLHPRRTRRSPGT